MYLALADLNTSREALTGTAHAFFCFRKLPETFIVRTRPGKDYFLFLEGAGPPSAAAEPLTWDEARRMAANIAKLPELLKQPPQ